MKIYGMESKASSFNPTLTSLETDVGLGLRPKSCSSHHGGRKSWRRREPSCPPTETTAPTDSDKTADISAKNVLWPRDGREFAVSDSTEIYYFK